MKKVFVCSPYQADTREERVSNMVRVRLYCRMLIADGIMPMAPHVYFTIFLDDSIHEDRNIGMEMGIEWLSMCDEIHVLGDRITDGMANEINFAYNLKIPVIPITNLGF